jgi:hypothetical protein
MAPNGLNNKIWEVSLIYSSRNAKEFFVIDVGNAAGVNVTFLGKSLGTPGRKGQVVHLRLPQQ